MRLFNMLKGKKTKTLTCNFWRHICGLYLPRDVPKQVSSLVKPDKSQVTWQDISHLQLISQDVFQTLEFFDPYNPSPSLLPLRDCKRIVAQLQTLERSCSERTTTLHFYCHIQLMNEKEASISGVEWQTKRGRRAHVQSDILSLAAQLSTLLQAHIGFLSAGMMEFSKLRNHPFSSRRSPSQSGIVGVPFLPHLLQERHSVLFYWKSTFP